MLCLVIIYFVDESVTINGVISDRARLLQDRARVINKWISNENLQNLSEDSLPYKTYIEKTARNLNARILILSKNNEVIYETNFSGIYEKLDFNKIDSIKKTLKPRYQRFSSSENKNVLYTIYPLVKNGIYYGSVVTISDLEAVIPDLNTEKVILYSILVVLIFTVILYLIFRNFLKPIDDIESGVSEITRGNYSHEIKESKTSFLSIIRSFNILAGRLSEIEKTQSQFISNISHELKTPIASMSIIAQSILESVDSIDKDLLKEFVNDIYNENIRLKNIIDELLYMAVLDKRDVSLNLEYRPINKLIHESIKVIKPIAEKKHIDIIFKQGKNIYGEVDYGKVKQVCINLLSNAIKYSPTGSKIKVKLTENKNEFIMAVEDEGYGISEEDQKYVFDRLYRVDKARSRAEGGTGLGLYISRQIVNLHMGTLELESKVNVGSTFTVTIPKRYRLVDKK